MTKDEIIKMAIEAWFNSENLPSICAANVYGEVNDELKRFAILVAAKAAAEENEACALMLDSWNTSITDIIAAEIRERHNKQKGKTNENTSTGEG